MSSAPESLFWLLHLSANLRRMQQPVLNHAMTHRLLHAGRCWSVSSTGVSISIRKLSTRGQVAGNRMLARVDLKLKCPKMFDRNFHGILQRRRS